MPFHVLPLHAIAITAVILFIRCLVLGDKFKDFGCNSWSRKYWEANENFARDSKVMPNYSSFELNVTLYRKDMTSRPQQKENQ